MLTNAINQLKTAFILLIIFTVLTGIIYPIIITVVAQLLFPWKANGSLIQTDERFVGSLLIGQSFSDEKYFWGRPSATTPYPYNAENSSGSNLGISNPDLLTQVKERAENIHKSNPNNRSLIPADLVTSSASGLDPEISPLAALYQIPRIAKSRHIPEADIQTLIISLTKNRTFEILGEPRINVIQLNIALDNLKK